MCVIFIFLNILMRICDATLSISPGKAFAGCTYRTGPEPTGEQDRNHAIITPLMRYPTRIKHHMVERNSRRRKATWFCNHLDGGGYVHDPAAGGAAAPAEERSAARRHQTRQHTGERAA
ncbi:hypothetical protein Vretifemale_16467, partial [Volvox reticuliferus]